MAAGGLILYPTDTIWGIGCDATNEEAVRKVYALKRRSDHKAMLLLMDSSTKLNYYVQEVPDVAWDLIELADSPLTVIYSGARIVDRKMFSNDRLVGSKIMKARNVAPHLMAADGSVGIRITHEEVSHKLCERFRKPLVSTSANVSGAPSPANFSEISDTIKSGVDYIVRYRQEDLSKAAPSHIIKLGAGGLVKIIR